MILLDTHVLLWLTSGDERLGRRSRAMIDSSPGAIAVSAISFWEVAMLVARGRVDLGGDTQVWRNEILTIGIEEISVSGETGIAAATLTSLHGDPADRIIVATAIARQAALLTADERILRWKSRVKRVDARR